MQGSMRESFGELISGTRENNDLKGSPSWILLELLTVFCYHCCCLITEGE